MFLHMFDMCNRDRRETLSLSLFLLFDEIESFEINNISILFEYIFSSSSFTLLLRIEILSNEIQLSRARKNFREEL